MPLLSAREYDIHGVGVRVASVAPALTDAIELRLRGFRHNPSRDTDLRFEFLSAGDGDRRRVGPPAGPSRPVYETPDGEILYYPRAQTVYGEFDGVRLRCEVGDGMANFESAKFAGRQLYLASHPLATIALMELLKGRERYSLHAACLSSGTAGLLLAGPSGAGKSTLAISLGRAGLSFLADDVVFLDLTSGTVEVLGFADAVGVTPATAERFSELHALRATPPPEGFPKHLIRVDDVFEMSTASRCEPRALIFPEIVPDRASRLSPLDPRDAWLRVVPDVLLTEPSTTQAHLDALAALLGQVGCFELRVGMDLDGATQLVRDLL